MDLKAVNSVVSTTYILLYIVDICVICRDVYMSDVVRGRTLRVYVSR